MSWCALSWRLARAVRASERQVTAEIEQRDTGILRGRCSEVAVLLRFRGRWALESVLIKTRPSFRCVLIWTRDGRRPFDTLPEDSF